MRYLASVSLLVLLLVGCLNTQPARNESLSPPVNERRVVVIGDSYTVGSDEGGRGDRGWPTLVWKAVDKQNVRLSLKVHGEGGAGYVQRGIHGGVFGQKIVESVGIADDLVVLFGSGNDVDVPPDDLVSTVRDDFAKVKQLAPRAKMLVIAPVWPAPNLTPRNLRVHDILRDHAAQVGATFVDPIAQRWIVDTPQLIGGDGVHPTDDGHKYLAQKISPLIYNASGS
jgi:lysophospholipase L1-like esterase